MRILFKTYGCSNNIAESEMMAGILASYGYNAEEMNGNSDGSRDYGKADYSKADAVVFNMCSVKGPCVFKCMSEIKKVKKRWPEKKIVIAGCIPQMLIPEIRKIDEKISIVNTHNIEKIRKALENSAEYSSYSKKVKLNLPRVRKNPVVGIVPILQGCNDFCTYCSTKLIKGPAVPYPEDKILKEVRQCLADGCKEIWLTSQDNGAYMAGKGRARLPELIKKISCIDGEFFVRVGMANPTYILEFIGELIEAMKNEKVFRFLHIPVQSGNDDVLRAMRRRYSVNDYKRIITRLKEKIPEITISTDVIAGFPGETERQFEDTLRLVKETKPDVLNISRYQPRPGTKAAMMKQLPGGAVKERSRKMTELFDRIALEQNRKWVGKCCKVIIDEKGKKKGQMIGRNMSYKQVVIENRNKAEIGSIVNVKIISAGMHHLVGRIV